MKSKIWIVFADLVEKKRDIYEIKTRENKNGVVYIRGQAAGEGVFYPFPELSKMAYPPWKFEKNSITPLSIW